jgi:hypothetical protein
MIKEVEPIMYVVAKDVADREGWVEQNAQSIMFVLGITIIEGPALEYREISVESIKETEIPVLVFQ